MLTDREIAAEPDPMSLGTEYRPATHSPCEANATSTFLFTDVEGSSKLWQQYPDGMRVALLRHDEIVATAIRAHSGLIFKTIGDAFCAAFERPGDAINAVVQIQTTLANMTWPDGFALRVRAAINSGEAENRDGDYFGSPLNLVSRLLGLAHGGQTLVSAPFHSTAQPLRIPGVHFRDLGSHRLKGIEQADHVYQLNVGSLDAEFPPLRTIEHASTICPRSSVSSSVAKKRPRISLAC